MRVSLLNRTRRQKARCFEQRCRDKALQSYMHELPVLNTSLSRNPSCYPSQSSGFEQYKNEQSDFEDEITNGATLIHSVYHENTPTSRLLSAKLRNDIELVKHCRAHVSRFYDRAKEITIQRESSQIGPGAEPHQEFHTLAFASRA